MHLLCFLPIHYRLHRFFFFLFSLTLFSHVVSSQLLFPFHLPLERQKLKQSVLNSVVGPSPSSSPLPTPPCREERLRGELGLRLPQREAGGRPGVPREHLVTLSHLIREFARCLCIPRPVRCGALCWSLRLQRDSWLMSMDFLNFFSQAHDLDMTIPHWQTCFYWYLINTRNLSVMAGISNFMFRPKTGLRHIPASSQRPNGWFARMTESKVTPPPARCLLRLVFVSF